MGLLCCQIPTNIRIFVWMLLHFAWTMYSCLSILSDHLNILLLLYLVEFKDRVEKALKNKSSKASFFYHQSIYDIDTIDVYCNWECNIGGSMEFIEWILHIESYSSILSSLDGSTRCLDTLQLVSINLLWNEFVHSYQYIPFLFKTNHYPCTYFEFGESIGPASCS